MHYTRETKVGIFVVAALAVLIFMGGYLGVYRFNTGKYVSHVFYFKDVTGLIKKSEVKMAGVKVGWVEQISLAENNGLCVRVDVMIDKEYTLYENASGLIRQEGLIGPVYLELFPGSSYLPKFTHESSMEHVHPEQTSMESVMRTLQDVALDMKDVARAVKGALSDTDLKNPIGQAVNVANRTLEQIHTQVLPAFTEGIEKVANFMDRDFTKIGPQIGRAAQFAADLCDACSHLYFVYDGHIEDMFERASFSCFRNSKGIFNVRVFPTSDYFYLFGVTASQQGYITRTLTFPDYVDGCLNEICKADELPEWARYQYIYNREQQVIKRNAFKVDLQFGKVFNRIMVRAGLIEGTAGFAVDVFLPYKERNGLISTFKMYDFRGQNRLFDERPHLKWINRIFIFNTIYIAFGFDDFVSKCNKSIFLGVGFRFGDEYMNCFFPKNSF